MSYLADADVFVIQGPNDKKVIVCHPCVCRPAEPSLRPGGFLNMFFLIDA